MDGYWEILGFNKELIETRSVYSSYPLSSDLTKRINVLKDSPGFLNFLLGAKVLFNESNKELCFSEMLLNTKKLSENYVYKIICLRFKKFGLNQQKRTEENEYWHELTKFNQYKKIYKPFWARDFIN